MNISVEGNLHSVRRNCFHHLTISDKMKRNKQKSFKSKAPKFRELNIESSEDSSNFVAEHRASSSEVDELDIGI